MDKFPWNSGISKLSFFPVMFSNPSLKVIGITDVISVKAFTIKDINVVHKISETKKEEIYCSSFYIVIQLGLEPRTLPRSGMLYLLLIISRIKDFDFLLLYCDPAGSRTQDPILKRDVLYQLSY